MRMLIDSVIVNLLDMAPPGARDRVRVLYAAEWIERLVYTLRTERKQRRRVSTPSK